MASPINTLKEQELTLQPLLLAVFTFSDGSKLRASSHPLKASDGGTPYKGNDYEGRILRWSLGPVQAVSNQGVSVVPSASITLADPDKFVWLNYGGAANKGFRGALLELTFVFHDLDTGAYSSDERETFIGYCGSPGVNDLELTVTAENRLNLQRRKLPAVPIQLRCPWINPRTASQRSAASNPDAKFYPCGETRDTTTAPPCQNTTKTCTQLLRRANITYAPPPAANFRAFTGEWARLEGDSQEAKYGSYMPLVYGVAWVDAVVVNTVPDGNATRGEAILSTGVIDSIRRVVVNDVELAPATTIDGGDIPVSEPLMRYNVINRGNRDGSPNQDVPYNGTGDPYGGIAAILFVVPRQVSEAAGSPRVRALVHGRQVRVYSSPTVYSTEWSENMAWVLLDALVQLGIAYDSANLTSFINASFVAGAGVQYTDQDGNTKTHSRYIASLVIKQRIAGSDVVNGLLRAMKGVLAQDADGKIALYIKQTLGDQQPGPVAGSNYDTPISSIDASGAAKNGYVAYRFDDSVIRRDDDSNKLQLSFENQPLSGLPNVVTVPFSNRDNDYSQDSNVMVEVDDIERMSDQQFERGLTFSGLPSLDHAKRAGNTFLAEQLRGNPQNSTAGTIRGELEPIAGFRAVHLRVGHLCQLDSSQFGVSNQLIRITSIRPGKNFETVTIGFAYHRDEWYTDAWGQRAEQAYQNPRRDRLERPSYPWAPYQVQPNSADPIYGETEWFFSIQERTELAADGTAIEILRLKGKQPINEPPAVAAPLVERQGTTATTGGSVPGKRTYYVQVATDPLSVGSIPAEIVVTAAGNTNTLTVAVRSWPAAATGYAVFAGPNPNRMTFQTFGSGTPSSITLTSYQERTWGTPDTEMDTMQPRIKRLWHSGVFGQAVDEVGTGTLKINAAGWTVNEWAGRDCSIIGKADRSELAVLNFRVVSNTSDTLTVTPDPSAAGIALNDTLVMRSTPTVGSDGTGNYIEDLKWINDLAGGGTGLTPGEEVGRLLRIVAGPGRNDPPYRIKANSATRVWIEGSWYTTPTALTRYIIESPTWVKLEPTESLSNGEFSAPIEFDVEVSNYLMKPVLVAIGTIDGRGNPSLPHSDQIREAYIYGDPGNIAQRGEGGWATIPSGDTVTPELSDGLTEQILLDRPTTTIEAALNNGVAPAAGFQFTLKLKQDATGSRAVVWNAAYIVGSAISEDPNSVSTFDFVANDAGQFTLRSTPMIGATA